MRHFLALPALLRASILCASATSHTFSVHEDLLAFPQYEVKFAEDYVTELRAQSRLQSNGELDTQTDRDASAQIEQYRPNEDGDDSGRDRKEKQKLEHEYMMLDNQRYLCSIPQIQKPNDDAGRNDTLSQAEEEKELARATDRGWELLSGMSGNCVYYFPGWWSYKFCYGQGVKQFHQLPPSRGVPVFPPVEDPSVPPFQLGLYQSEEEKKEGESDDETTTQITAQAETQGLSESEVENALDVSEGSKAKHRRSGNSELVQRGESRYLVQRLGGGTKCDLTGKDRKVEVQFHCNPQSSDRISLIQETSTCAYLMIIQTPRLCNDVAFLPPQKDQPNPITCSPILADDEVETYTHDLDLLREAEEEATKLLKDSDNLNDPSINTDDTPPLLQIAGDILIGGHALVPAGTKLEKGAIVGGGKETYIDTVASSDGKVLSDEEIERQGLGDPRAVEKLRKDLEKIAKGQSWKLDVVATARGEREYRGIIGDDEEEGEGEGEGEAGKEGGKEKGEGKGKGVGKGKGKGEGKDEGQAKGDREEGDGEMPEGSEEEYYREEL